MCKKDRAALYCRIKNNNDESKADLAAREKKFMETVKSNSDIMEFAGVYTDFGGANDEHRSELERLITNCEAGKIDLVITKNMFQIHRNTASVLSLILNLRKFNPNFRIRFEDFGSDTGRIDFYKILEAIVKSEKNNTFGFHISHQHIQPVSNKKTDVYHKMLHR